MVVSGVIVETLPGKEEGVKNCLDIMDDVAIYREIDECRLAVIITFK